MKNNHLHTGNTTKKSTTRARLVFCAFAVVAAITLAGVALAAGPEKPSAPGSKAQIVAENPDASSIGKNPIAEKYDTLVMRVYFSDRAERDRLAEELQPEEVPTTGGYLTVIRDRKLYYALTARGLRVEIDENSSRKLSDPQLMIDTFYNGYKTVEEIYAFLDQKVAQFPGLVEKIDIGDSWCKLHPGSCVLPSPWNGYDLFVLHLTNRNVPGPKPVFWADGDIHAREIATPEVVMRMIDYLLNNYDTNADVHWLLDHHDIWLMPEVNPDGHHIVEAGGSGSNPYMYRKNGNNTGGGSCSWPPTSGSHFGVDANRNFPFRWGCCNGSSGLVCEQTYRGTSAGSEPETTAIVNKLRTLVADQRGPLDTDAAPLTATGVYQNIHTVAGINLHTWGWTTTQIPNYAETHNIAAHMAAPNASGNGYPYGSIIDQLYPVDGGSIDWAYGELGMASFSTELGGQDFLPSYACIDNPGCGSSQGIWPENRGMLLYLAKIARTPYLTSHGPDANTVAANPASVVQGVPSQLTASITFAWASNAFSQNVGAAEYYIDTPPWAGGTAIPMTGTFTSPTTTVTATINTAGLSFGRHVIFVRGRGVTDFQTFQTWGPITAAFLDITGGPTPTPSLTPGGPTATPTSTPAVTPTPTPTPTVIPSPTPVAAVTVIVGHNGGTTFEPASVTIQPGDTVRWLWETGTHSVTSGPPLEPDGLFDSGVHSTPFTFFHTFATAGNFPYFCNVHGTMMTGAVTVGTPSATPTIAPSATPSIAPTATPSLTPGATATPTSSPTPPAQAMNLSTRMLVQTGDNVGIGGFIIEGSAPKHVFVHAVGPSSVPGALADPVLELHGPAGFVTVTNDNCAGGQIEVPGSFCQPGSLDAGIEATLDPGAYTAVVRGKNNATGVALVEVYDLDQTANSKLGNISTRAFVSTGDNILIAGFILGGSSGLDQILIRGIGPSLGGFGVPNPLADPTLELRDNNGTLLDSNDNWQDSPTEPNVPPGLQPTSNLESVITATLPPGLYTALLAGVNGGTGVGLVEVYDRGAP